MKVLLVPVFLKYCLKKKKKMDEKPEALQILNPVASVKHAMALPSRLELNGHGPLQDWYSPCTCLNLRPHQM